jgi:hypothetical protein
MVGLHFGRFFSQTHLVTLVAGGDAAKAETEAVADHTGSTSNVHPLLSSFINYTHPIKFQGAGHKF